MPMGTIQLRPGVNTQRTLAANEAGVSESNLIRYKDQLIQKVGGWDLYYPLTIDSTIREVHGWQVTDGNQYLAVGATASLNVITAGSLSNITPLTRISSFTRNFSVNASCGLITVGDSNANLSIYDVVFFNTQVSVGGANLQGGYPVYTVGGSSSYTVLSTGVSSAAVVSSGILPTFATSANNAVVTVDFPNNGYQSIPGLYYPFIAPTTLGGLTIQGSYGIFSIIDSTQFQIVANQQSTANATSSMNNGVAQVVYYIAHGPPPGGTGYGLGGYGLGGYGLGQTSTATGSGTAISATDWSLDNWGDVLLANPKNGAIYVWSPQSGFETAAVVPTAPFFNGGIFISMPQQILVAWDSCLYTTGVQDPLTIRWSDAEDYTQWTITNATAAGSFHIPTGSEIRGGLQAANYGVIWTDIDVWVMQYVGGTEIFNLTRVGSGCGLIGPHAGCTIAGNVYWCGLSSFFAMTGQGVQALNCTVWDFIFQNLDATNSYKIRCAPNSTFTEVAWYFPVSGGDGENSAYVKYNILEGEWDYGYLGRNAWIDVTALGNPIGTDIDSIYQHETTTDANGQPIGASFQSGYWSIAEGNEMAFVDWFLPDMKFGTYGSTMSAQIEVTFNTVDYLGDAPRTYGPFTFTSTTQYLSPRLRGRFMSVTIASNDTTSFWRIGSCRYRWAPAGRR